MSARGVLAYRFAIGQGEVRAAVKESNVAQIPPRRKKQPSKAAPTTTRAAPHPAKPHSVSSLDVGTLEELLAGLFSLRGDLNQLAREIDRLREDGPAKA